MLRERTDRESRMPLSKAYEELGEVTSKIGSKPEAIAVHRKALAIRRELASGPNPTPESVVDLGKACWQPADSSPPWVMRPAPACSMPSRKRSPRA